MTGAASGALAEKAGLIGAWRLQDCVLTYPDGKVQRPYGDNPNGVIMYTPDGWMSCHMQGGRKGEAKPEDAPLLIYTGYFGPYTMQDDGKTVVHHVKGSSEAMVAGDQVRNYAFNGNELTLSAEMAGIKAVLRWAR